MSAMCNPFCSLSGLQLRPVFLDCSPIRDSSPATKKISSSLAKPSATSSNLQTEIVRKVNKIQPFVRVLGVASAVMTAGIVGIFTYDAWQHLK